MDEEEGAGVSPIHDVFKQEEFQFKVVCPVLAKSDSILRGKQVNSAILNIY